MLSLSKKKNITFFSVKVLVHTSSEIYSKVREARVLALFQVE